MTQKEAEFVGRLIVGMVTMALYVQTTKAIPSLAFSMLQQLGGDLNKDHAMDVLSAPLFLEAIHDYLALPIVLMADIVQKILDNLPPHQRVNQEPVFDRMTDLWAEKLNRIAVAMGLYGLISGVAACVYQHKDMPPVKAVTVGVMTTLVCYGVKNLVIDTVGSELRQLLDVKAAKLAR